jgi:hypothetical protein
MVHRGEAYAHAAALVLGSPCLTNDRSAVNTLRRAGRVLSTHILRSFDVLTFVLQAEIITLKDCEECRSTLITAGERIPECFVHRSFETGLPNFFTRLLDANNPACGANTSDDALDKRLWIRRLSLAASG